MMDSSGNVTQLVVIESWTSNCSSISARISFPSFLDVILS